MTNYEREVLAHCNYQPDILDIINARVLSATVCLIRTDRSNTKIIVNNVSTYEETLTFKKETQSIESTVSYAPSHFCSLSLFFAHAGVLRDEYFYKKSSSSSFAESQRGVFSRNATSHIVSFQKHSFARSTKGVFSHFTCDCVATLSIP